MDHPFPEDCVARFRPERQLASGGFGTVWLGTHIQLGRKVALKVLLARALDDREQVARFINEGRITAQLEHPNIVVVHDLGAEHGVPWIAYELISGPTLREQIQRQRPSVAAALGAVAQVASALEKAHEHGVLHRDIKPENVLEASAGHYKVTDFGIARWSGQSEVHTKTGVILGTPSYLPPELIRGEPVSTRSDLYSLGIMLFELLTGAPPFRGDSLIETMRHHVLTQPTRPSSLCAGLPPVVDDIVLRLLAKIPEERPSSATELVEALKAALPLVASPVSAGRPSGVRSLPATAPAATVGAVVRATNPQVTASAPEADPPAPVGAPESAVPQAAPTQARPASSGALGRPGRARSQPGARLAPSLSPRSVPPASISTRWRAALASCLITLVALVAGAVALRERRSGEPPEQAPPPAASQSPPPSRATPQAFPDIVLRLEVLAQRIERAVDKSNKAVEEVERASSNFPGGPKATEVRREAIDNVKIGTRPARVEFQELVKETARLGLDVLAATPARHLEAAYFWAAARLTLSKAMRVYSEEHETLERAFTSWGVLHRQSWLPSALLACVFSTLKGSRARHDAFKSASGASQLLCWVHAFDPEDPSADADIVAAWLLLRTIEANTMDTGTAAARSTKEGIWKQTQRIAHVRRMEGRMSPLFHAVARTLGLLQ